jgi:RNA-directed DNA polymerase
MQLGFFDNVITTNTSDGIELLTQQTDLKKQLLYDLFTAYYDARQNKRNTKSALLFERNYESHLLELYENIINRTYEIKPSVCFINYAPVQREIFAAHFSDRIVHHLVYNYISPIFERVFINDSYSCRTSKGTSFGIKRVNHFIKACSDNYQKDCYILKLDIKGYFMAINRQLLFEKTIHILEKFRERTFKQIDGSLLIWKQTFDFETVNYLLEKIIFNNPVDNYLLKGSLKNWDGLPASKSLFHSDIGCGLPIGNLTSQLFSNIYLNDFDHWIYYKKGCKYFGRYVDDFFVVHNDKEFLKDLIPKIKTYLKENLTLELHPKKIYLQHYSKGVKFLGAVIKPHRIYIANRTKGNFYEAIEKQNIIARDHKPTKEEQKAFLSSMNSYLGIIKHYKSFKLRKEMISKKLSGWWFNYVYAFRYEKFVFRKKKLENSVKSTKEKSNIAAK